MFPLCDEIGRTIENRPKDRVISKWKKTYDKLVYGLEYYIYLTGQSLWRLKFR